MTTIANRLRIVADMLADENGPARWAASPAAIQNAAMECRAIATELEAAPSELRRFSRAVDSGTDGGMYEAHDGDWVEYDNALVSIAALQARVAELQKPEQWYCESHPEHEMGHDGCDGAGILECARIGQMQHKIRMADQARREAEMMRDDVAAQAKARVAELEARQVPPAGSKDAEFAIGIALGDRGWPANPKNAARAGWEACRAFLAAAPSKPTDTEGR